MASPIDDPRYALARMMRAQSQSSGSYSPLGVAPSKASVSLGRTASNMAAANPTLRQAIERIQQGKPAAPTGGLGLLMNNPLTKVGLNALTALALPGKTVIAGLREGIDAIDANPETKASFGDVKKNIKDPTFGFGKAFNIDTGSKWLDRAIGFVGDVALDPITYVTFGAGKAASQAGRLDLAKMILRNTDDANLANLAQRYGRSAIKNPEVLEAAGFNRHGLYLLGKRVNVGKAQQGLRIPGTGAIGQFGDNALAKLRISAMGTKAGKFVQKITLPGEYGVARRALLQGEVGDEAAAGIIGALTASPTGRKAAGVALQSANRELLEKMQRAEGAGLEAYAKEVYKYIEDPELLKTAPKQIQDAYEEWGPGFFQRLENEIGGRMAEVDPNHKWTGVENYFTRIHTEKAIDYMSDARNPFSKALNEIVSRDPLAGADNFKSRTLQINDDWFGHPLSVEDLKSTDRLNELARPSLGGADFFETDIRVVAQKYVRSYAEEIGLLAKHKHLVDTGFWKRAEAVEMGEEFLDKELMASVKNNIKSLSDDLNEAYKMSSKAYLNLEQTIEDLRSGKVAELKELTSSKGALGVRESLVETERAIDDVLNGSLTLTADSLQTVADLIGKINSKFAGLFGAKVTKSGKLVLIGSDGAAEDAPMILGGVVKYLDDLEKDVTRLYDEFYPLERDWVGKELEAAHTAAAVALKNSSDRFKIAQKRVQDVLEFGNQIENTLNAIARGESTGDIGRNISDVIEIVGRGGDLSNSTVKEIQEKTLGAKGKTTKFLRNKVNEPDGLVSRSTVSSPIQTDNVVKMSITDFYNDLPGVFTNEHSLTHVREMALFALLKDDRLYGDSVPDFLVSMRTKLEKQLLMADNADAFISQTLSSADQTGRLNAAKIFESQWKPAFNNVLNLNEDIVGMEDFINRFRNGIAGNESVLSSPVDWDSMTPYLQKYAWLGDMEPNTSATSYIEDLMGMSDVVPMRGGKTVELGGNTIPDQQFTVSSYGEQTTYADLLQLVEDGLSNNKQLMSGEFFEFGSGATAKRYTGTEVLAIKREYDSVVTEIGNILDARRRTRKIWKGKKGYYDLDLGTPAGRAKRATLDLEAQSVWQSKEKQEMYETLLRRKKEIEGGGARVEGVAAGSAAITHENLGNELMNYTVVSEVMSRWTTMSQYLAAFGYVPTERMFSEVTQSVSSKFMPIIEREMAQTNIAKDIVFRLDREIAAAISANAGEASPNSIFRRFVDALSDRERDILVDAVGTKINWGADPAELRIGLTAFKKQQLGDDLVKRSSEVDKAISGFKNKKLTDVQARELEGLRVEQRAIAAKRRAAESAYLRDVVKPWFEAAYPGKTADNQSMKAALAAQTSSSVKKNKRKVQTPWAVDADVTSIKRFFEGIIGDSQIPGKRGVLGTKINSLDIKTKSLREAQRRFKRLLSPDMDIRQFLDDPSAIQKTPSFYAYALQRSADILDTRIATKQAANINIKDLRAEQASAGVSALEKTQQVADIVGPYRGAEPAVLPKASQDALNKTQAAIDRINLKPKLSKNERERLATLEGILQTQKDEIAAASASPFPKSFTEPIRTSGAKISQIETAESSVSAAKKALDDIAELAKPLRNKKRTKAGLNKTETSKLASLEKRAAKAQEALAAAREGRAKIPKLSSAETRATQLPQGVDYRELAGKNVDQYNAMMESPMYAKSLADQEMVSAMDELSGINMHEYRDGFITSEGVVATLPDGKPIVFSNEEWRSLYNGSLSPVESNVRRTNIRVLIKEVEAEIEKLSISKNALVVEVSMQEARRAAQQKAIYSAGLRGEGRYLMERFKKLPDLAREAQEKLDDIAPLVEGAIKKRDDLLADLGSFNQATRNSALLKIRILTQGRKGQAPVFDRAGLQKFLDYTHPTQRAMASSAAEQTEEITGVAGRRTIRSFVDESGRMHVSPKVSRARKTGLQRSWTDTEEYKFIQKLASMEDDTFVQMYKSMDDDVESLIEYRDSFTSRINSVIEESQVVGSGVREVRAVGQEQARQGSDALADLFKKAEEFPNYVPDPNFVPKNAPLPRAETGRVPLSSSTDELPIPTTPAEMEAYSASLLERAQPGGPRVRQSGEYGSFYKNVENEEKIVNLTDELEKLKKLNNRGALDEKNYRRMIAVENQIGNLRRENLNNANLLTASDELQSAYMADRSMFLAKREAASNLEAWSKPTRDPVTNDIIPSGRDKLMVPARKQWEARAAKTEDARAVVKALEAGSVTVRAKMASISGSVDNFWRDVHKQRGVAEALRDDIAQIDDLIRSMPTDESRKLLRSISSARGVKANAEKVEETLRAYRKWSGENKRVFELLANSPDDPVYKAWAAAGLADEQMIYLEAIKPGLLNDFLSASTPVWKTTVLDTFDKGYEKVAKESGLLMNMSRVDARLFPSIYGNTEALDLLKSIDRIKMPGVKDDLSKFMRGYTGFFKSYATLSPGFHVRNGISNTFSMFAAGADLKNMREGFRLWRMLDDALKKGQSLDSFVNSLPVEQQMAARTAAETMLGLGNGKVDNAMEGFIRGGSKIRDNKLLDMSRTSGQKIEGSARFMLAYDSMVKGFTPDEAFNRTRRYLIDYSEKTILDEAMRDIIPFWTWMSRNFPLQIVNRWTNPKPYLMYEKFARNFAEPLEEGEVTPGYLAESEAINFGGGQYLSLDLPFSRIDEQVQDLTNPSSWLGYVNPGIKVPLEMAFNKNTFTGKSFGDEYVPLTGPMSIFLPALKAAGQVEYNSKGKPVVREKIAYALRSTNPLLGRAENLSAGGIKGDNAMNAFLGIPKRTASPGSQDAERYAQLANLQALQNRRKSIEGQ